MKPEETRKLMKKTCDAYHNHKKRARKHGASLDYTLDEIRTLLGKSLNTECPFCGSTITLENFSFDHSEPVSRGGHHHINNLVVSCKRCNEIKGNMNTDEFQHLIQLTQSFHPSAQQSLMARIRAGGRIIHN